MKVIYEFDPYEDMEELEVFRKARNYYAALSDIEMGKIRAFLKFDCFDGEELSDRERKMLIEIQQEICDILNERDAHVY